MKHLGKWFGLAASVSLSVALAAACGGDDGNNTSTSASTSGMGGSSTTTTGNGPTTSAGGSTSSTGSGPECPPTKPEHPGKSSNIDEIKGKITDRQGNPADDILTDVCGTNICLSGHSDKNGSFVVDGMNAELLDVALIYGNGHGYVKMATPITTTPKFDFGDINTVKLPAFSEGAAIKAGADATNNGVTVTIAAGANIKFDKILYPEESMHVFRAVVFKPDEGNFVAIDKSLGLELLVGTAAINTDICPPAKLSVPNSEGWDADAAVEFHYHNYNTFNHWAPYAGWTKIAEGKVSSDGKTIVTNDGEGVPQLGLFGLKRK